MCMGFKMLLRCVVVLIVVFLTPRLAFSEADGPDFFRIKSPEAPIREQAQIDSPIVAVLTAGTVGLRNLGCSGIIPYGEWVKLNAAEKKISRENVWCKVSFLHRNDSLKDKFEYQFGGISGWIQNIHLQEYGAPSSPVFNCDGVKPMVEQMICKDMDLMIFDHTLNNVYKSSLEAVSKLTSKKDKKAAKSRLVAIQRGWIKGRNDCWKEQEKAQSCVTLSYLQRIVTLQAEWGLVRENKQIIRFVCENDDRNEFYATYLNLILPVVIVERGDSRDVFIENIASQKTEANDNKINGRYFSGTFGNQLTFFETAATLRWRNEKFDCRIASSH